METESRRQKRQGDLDFSFGGQFDFGQFSRLANARGDGITVGMVRLDDVGDHNHGNQSAK